MLTANNREYTGAKMELCTCGQIFNNTRAADRHRVVEYLYAILRLPNGKTMRVRMESLEAIKPLGYKIHSVNNEARRCLTPEEMRKIGMNQEKNLAWNNGGAWAR